MTPTATQDEDLIILSDSVTPTFDETPIVSDDVNKESTPIISFDDNSLIENNSWEQKIDEVTEVSQVNELNLDSWVNYLFWDDTKKEEEKVEVSSEENSSDDLFWNVDFSSNLSEESELPKQEETTTSSLFWDTSSSVQLDISETDTNSDIWDMNSILDSTIAKLKTRQDLIGGTKSQKQWTIADLEAQIKELRDQVSWLKKDVESLDDENMKIDINISTLESMKLWQNIKVPMKREHNIKRVAKVA